MSPKIKGYLVGIALSLVGVGAYIGLAFAEYMSSFVPMIMAYLFYIGYNMFNKENKEKSFFVALSIVTIVETLLSVLVFALILCMKYDVSLSEMLDFDEVRQAFIQDSAVSLLFAFIGIAVVIYEIKRKEKIASRNSAQ